MSSDMARLVRRHGGLRGPGAGGTVPIVTAILGGAMRTTSLGAAAALAVGLLAAAAGRSAAAHAADVVFVNGRGGTVDKAHREAEALAVWRDRVLAVGSSADVRKLAGPQTRVIDLRGRRVVPGFYDSHVHLLGSGLRLS